MTGVKKRMQVLKNHLNQKVYIKYLYTNQNKNIIDY